MNPLLIASVLIPFALAFLGLIPRFGRICGTLAPWASLPALVLAFAAGSDTGVLNLPAVLFGTQLGLDGVGRIFLFLTALLWLASGFFTPRWDCASYVSKRYWFFHLLTLTGNLGVTLSQDAGSFYTFFAMMTYSAFGMISHDGSQPARTAGRVYLALAVFGEMLILAGLVLGSHAADSVNISSIASATGSAMGSSPLGNAIFALIFVGFGVKVGLLPLHVWLPLSYSAAPIPAAAVLSGALTKAGILGWLRFLPLGLMTSEGWADLVIASGALMAIYGAGVGIAQTSPRTALAYSSLSQMGYLTIAVGTAFEPGAPVIRSIAACVAYAIHHGIAKAALFLGVPLVAATPLASRARKFLLIVLLLTALSLVGVPLSGGEFVKGLLKGSGAPDGLWQITSGIFMTVGSIATALLVARFMVLYARIQSEPVRLSVRLILPWSVLVLLSILSPWIVPRILTGFEAAFSAALTERTASGSTLTLLAVFAAVWLSRSVWNRRTGRPGIPPGDILLPIQRVWDVVRPTIRNIIQRVNILVNVRLVRMTSQIALRAVRGFSEFEKLRNRGFAGTGLLLLVWAMFWLLLRGGTR